MRFVELTGFFSPPMLKQLTPSQYPLIAPLFAPLDFNLAIRSVIAGNTPGWVFADRPTAPGVSLIWNLADALLLAGPNQDVMTLAALRNLLHHHILPQARSRGIPELALFAAPVWESIAPKLLSGLDAAPAPRRSYRLEPGAAQDLPPLAPGFCIQPITADLLEGSAPGVKEVRGWVDSFWHTPQDFLDTGFGFCAVEVGSGEVASWCLTVYAAGEERELGVATAPRFRGRGLAAQAAAACTAHAAAKGIRLHWHCWTENRPSAAVAEKLGFQRDRDYTAFRILTGAA